MAYPSQGVALIVVNLVFPILAFATILLRVKARSNARKSLDFSDYFLFFAMVRIRMNSRRVTDSDLSSLLCAIVSHALLELCLMAWDNLALL